jgi:hypothetical protein
MRMGVMREALPVLGCAGEYRERKQDKAETMPGFCFRRRRNR